MIYGTVRIRRLLSCIMIYLTKSKYRVIITPWTVISPLLDCPMKAPLNQSRCHVVLENQTGNAFRKRQFYFVILSFLTCYITSAGQVNDITCRSRIINILGSTEPVGIVEVGTNGIVTVKTTWQIYVVTLLWSLKSENWFPGYQEFLLSNFPCH